MAGCGGGGAPQSDADAVAQVLKDAVKAVADGDGDKACSYLTPDAQRQAQLQLNLATFTQHDCPKAVAQVASTLTPDERDRLRGLEPANVQVNGTSASATMLASGGALRVHLQKDGSGWKISGFG